MTIDTSQLPTFDAADVVVVGSGSAGAVAARQTPRQLSIRKLQARLLSAGVLAGRGESLEGTTEWQGIKTTCC